MVQKRLLANQQHVEPHPISTSINILYRISNPYCSEGKLKINVCCYIFLATDVGKKG